MQFGKKVIGAIILLFILSNVSGISGVSADTLDVDLLEVDVSTEHTSYQYEDEITSTITIKNDSNRYSAKNIEVETGLSSDFDIINDEDVVYEDGKIIWEIEEIDRGEEVELTFQKKFNESLLDAEENDDASVSIEDGKEVSSEKESDKENDLVAPQTGDESNMMNYVILLIVSIAFGVFGLLLVRKKKLAKSITVLLAVLIVTPTLTQVHAEGKGPELNIQTIEASHQYTVGDAEYELKTKVTSEVHDHYVEIPVTGVAYDEAGEVLANESLTFSAEVYDEYVEEVIETDEEGYFVSRLAQDATYVVESESVQAEIIANDMNDISLTNTIGKIELGKTLSNGDNQTRLQPSVIYLSGEEAEEFQNIDLESFSVTHVGDADIQSGDIIVLPEREGFPGGVSFTIDSTDSNGVLRVAEPELENLFYEIIGDLSVEVSEENFVPAEGVEVLDESEPAEVFGPMLFSTRAATSPKGKVKLSLNGLFDKDKDKDKDGISFGGDIELSGQVYGDIHWRFGLNPVESLDFNYQGEQKLNLELEFEKKHEFPDVNIGTFIIPTQVPGVVVSLPVDLVSSVSGDVSLKVSTGMKENIGVAYERGSGVRMYPDEKITPFFNLSDVNGTGEAAVGLRLSGLARALGWDLVGISATGEVKASASTSILGGNGFFQCASLDATFNPKLTVRAPIFKWESKTDIGTSFDLWSGEIGDCISSIQVNPDELELEPGQTKSIEVYARDESSKKLINDNEKLNFEADNSEIIQVDPQRNKVDIQASNQAQHGDTYQVKVTYDQNSRAHSDTLTIRIVDEREKGELIGEVSDAIEGTPLVDAEVKVYSSERLISEVQTDDNGSYKVNLAPGDYKVEVSYPEYITDTSRIRIASTDTTTYDAKLQLVGNEFGGIGTVSGLIKNAVNGLGVEAVTLEIRQGKNNTDGEIIDTIQTDQSGNYTTDLPGGNYTFQLSKEDYITTHMNVIAIGEQEKANQNGTISPDGVIDDNLRIVLTWGKEPRDLDSHLTGPRADGDRFHIYYGSKRYQDEFNNVNLDRDDVSSYGPETVTVINRMQEGTYSYAVHNYTGRRLTDSNQLDLANSSAKVEVYRANTLLETFNVPLNKAGNSWRVFEIKDGEIIPVNKIETTDTWSSASDFAPIN